MKEEQVNKNIVDVGWYSKEDMNKVLKWNPTLAIYSCTHLHATKEEDRGGHQEL